MKRWINRELRPFVVDFAKSKGYEKVEFLKNGIMIFSSKQFTDAYSVYGKVITIKDDFVLEDITTDTSEWFLFMSKITNGKTVNGLTYAESFEIAHLNSLRSKYGFSIKFTKDAEIRNKDLSVQLQSLRNILSNGDVYKKSNEEISLIAKTFFSAMSPEEMVLWLNQNGFNNELLKKFRKENMFADARYLIQSVLYFMTPEERTEWLKENYDIFELFGDNIQRHIDRNRLIHLIIRKNDTIQDKELEDDTNSDILVPNGQGGYDKYEFVPEIGDDDSNIYVLDEE